MKVLIAYIPVLHQGYKLLLERTGDDVMVFVMGLSITERFDYLRKEIRALLPKDACNAISSWGFRVLVLEKRHISLLKKECSQIIAPDEDVVREFLEAEFPEIPVQYEPVFLRWDRGNTEINTEITPDREVDVSSIKSFANIAVGEAVISSDWWRQVGSVAFKDGEVILSAHNRHLPSPHTPWAVGDPRNVFKRGVGVELGSSIHAEGAIIAQAAKLGISLEGAEIFVTDFPCPSCAKLIAFSGFVRCYYATGYAMLDGMEVLKSFGVEVVKVGGFSLDFEPHRSLPYPKKGGG